jgi:hypothetical protein
MAADQASPGLDRKLWGAAAVLLAAAVAVGAWASVPPDPAHAPLLTQPSRPCSALPEAVLQRYVPGSQATILTPPTADFSDPDLAMTGCTWFGGGSGLSYMMSSYLVSAQAEYSVGVTTDVQSGSDGTWPVSGLGSAATAVFQNTSSEMDVRLEVWSGDDELQVTVITSNEITSEPSITAFSGQLSEAVSVARKLLAS